LIKREDLVAGVGFGFDRTAGRIDPLYPSVTAE
jgi:hypothetical protein